MRKGAEVNGLRANGLTPLLAAAGNPNPETARFLILAGAEPRATDPAGRTALMLAAWLNQNDEVVKILASGGVDLTARDRQGRSVLDYLGPDRPDLADFLSRRQESRP